MKTMAVLLTCQSIGQQFGSSTLFENVSLTIHEGERHGLIGPNGAGKSTLLKVLAGLQTPSHGEVALRKGVRMAYVPQEPDFDASKSVQQILEASAREASRIPSVMGQAGFSDGSALSGSLSGGWRKRLMLAAALVQEPDLLLLDEPTNHLDVEGITWLERLLCAAPFASVVVSHDRYFLENVATHVMELNPVYPDGLFRSAGGYSDFLEAREQFEEARSRQQEALATKVRREVEWLRRGAKARTRKSKARIDAAGEMIGNLADMESRSRRATAQIEFTSSDRRTKRLLEADGVGLEMGGRPLVQDLKLVLAPGQRLGLAGANGSGKTTLLRVLLGELSPQQGEIRRADGLRTIYFEQHRRQVDLSATLKQALAPEGDSVIYHGRTIHVNGWAKRFLFREDQLPQPVSSLSGGELARVHIARLMREEADVLLLDEPTNDLDIPTLEVLEESLLEFTGALVLVTHDRYLMDRVATAVLGLDGEGGATIYADLNQWQTALEEQRRAAADQARSALPAPAARPVTERKRLSYTEQREWQAIEGRIEEAEARLSEAHTLLQAPETVSDHRKLEETYAELKRLQEEVDQLYARWAELDGKLKSIS